MDILVLDAPMKFIHGKMVEQGANEWSRYLASQFNPIGRGTLYTERFDKKNGLTVCLYSANITLHCVGESKGYLKAVKAEETDVLAYHRAIEEGKLLEEKITFVPVYKFQYINGKEHHDVEYFMQAEKEKRDFANYINLWKGFMADGQKADGMQEVEVTGGMEQALRRLYEGKTAHSDMSDFMPTVEKLKPFEIKELDDAHLTTQYDMLSSEAQYTVKQALSTEDLYFVDTKEGADASILMREIVQQVIAKRETVLLVAPDSEQVGALLKGIEEHCMDAKFHAEVAQLQSMEETEISPYTLEYKVNHLRDSVLRKLIEEATKHNRHKEELDQMRAECDIYQNAEKTIGLGFDILEVLQEIEEDKVKLQQESLSLGEQGMAYVESLDKYMSVPNKQHEVYKKLKEELGESAHLYDEMLWVNSYRELVDYQKYKALVLEYSRYVQEFEEKLSTYKKQIQERDHYDAQYKALEAKLLEVRRQYLKVETLKQIDPNGSIVQDTDTKEIIEGLEQELHELRQKRDEEAIGIVSTRYLDELKEKVYKLKEEVEVYMNEYSSVLTTVCHKENVTKADVMNVFARMYKVEKLFEDENAYTTYLEGVEEYLELEVIVEKNNQLIKLQEENQEKMALLLKKQEEVMSLLEAKLEEELFKVFLELIEEGEECVKHILQEPLGDTSSACLEELEAAVHQRAFKLQIYNEKVAFYDDLAKLKVNWQSHLEEDKAILMNYLADKVNVVGTTSTALMNETDKALLREDFEYVIIHEAQDIPNLELLVALVRGKKAIIIGDSTKEVASLFTKLYERVLRTHKKALIEVC